MTSMIASILKHPQWVAAKHLIDILSANHYKAYLAGGCVRDAIMGRVAKDLDLATDAPIDVLEKLFPDHIAVGKQFGVLIVKQSKQTIEVATFREDGPYEDGRRPKYIKWASAKEDALRRDFTMNALFMDIKSNKIIDYVDGQKDIQKKIIRAVGAAPLRLEEDKLRILRAIRFAAQLGFSIESQLLAALSQYSQELSSVSKERITEELNKMFKSEHLLFGWKLMFSTGCLQAVFPKLKNLHKKVTLDLFLLRIQRRPSFLTTFYALLFFTAEEDLNSIKNTLNNFSFSNDQKSAIIFCLSRQNQLLKLDTESLLLLNDRFGLELWDFVLCVYPEKEPQLMELKKRYLKLSQDKMRLPEPILSGHDLLNMNFEKGPLIKKILDSAYIAQLEAKFNDLNGAKAWVLSSY